MISYPTPHVIYQSAKAAEDMLEAIKLLPDKIKFDGITYVNEETADANLEMAKMYIEAHSDY